MIRGNAFICECGLWYNIKAFKYKNFPFLCSHCDRIIHSNWTTSEGNVQLIRELEFKTQFFTCIKCNWHYKNSVGRHVYVICPKCKNAIYTNKRRTKMKVQIFNQKENEKTVSLGLRKVGDGVEVVIHDKHGCVKGKIFKFQDDGKIFTYYACEEVQGLFQTDNNNRFRVSNL